jgi:hypothetical protein
MTDIARISSPARRMAMRLSGGCWRCRCFATTANLRSLTVHLHR